MAKKSQAKKKSDQSSIKSANTSVSSVTVSRQVASAVQKAKSILRPSKKMKPTLSTRSGSSTAIPLSINSDDNLDEKIAESVLSDDSSPVEMVEEVDPEQELGMFQHLFHIYFLIYPCREPQEDLALTYLHVLQVRCLDSVPSKLCLGFIRGIPRVQIWYTVPVPADTVPFAGKGTYLTVNDRGVYKHRGIPYTCCVHGT